MNFLDEVTALILTFNEEKNIKRTLSALSRFPTEKEKTALLQEFASVKPEEKRLVVEDLYWAILASREFLFNH